MPPRPERWTLPAHPESVPVLRRAVTTFARGAGFTERPLGDVALAVSEAVTNTVLHAYPDGEGEVRVEVCVDEDGGLMVSVEDDGPGIAPRAESPGLGLGLATIAAVAERLELESAAGACVRMRFPPPR